MRPSKQKKIEKDNKRLKPFSGDGGQVAALAILQSYMAENFLPLHPLRRISEAVGTGIQIGIVNLIGVAGKHHLGILAGTGDDGFHFVRGEVLGLIHENKLVRDAAAANLSKGLHFESAGLLEFINASIHRGISGFGAKQ